MPQSPRAKGHDFSTRARLLRPPIGAKALSAWSLLPLRIFLGATFTYAGLQKLANPNFFDAKSPISIQNQLIAAARISPIHALLSHLGGVAVPIGVLIAVGEVAIGLGTLFGLFTRVAAIAGLFLSLSLFLTVSFHASPFFTGADIVFLFAWTPFIVAGGGTQLSLDAWMKERVATEHERPSPVLVPISFATVQVLCGHYDQGKCKARGGKPCDAAACPVLLGDEQVPLPRDAANATDRRAVVLGGALAAAVGTSVVISGAAAAVAGRLIDGAPKPKGQGNQLAPPSSSTTTTSPTTATTTTVPQGPTTSSTTTTTAPGSAQGQLLGAASQVPKNEAASFTIPSNGDPGIVIHTASGEFVGYDAVCPHTGCTVGYSNTAQVIVCPCHGSEFQVANGDVIVGPAPHGLTKLKIVEGANGNLYLQ